MKDPRDMSVGDTFTYPETGWLWLARVPDNIALAWVKDVVPQAVVGAWKEQTAEKITDTKQWLNKLAVIVEEDHRLLALYKHDFHIWLLKYEWPTTR